MQPSHASNKTNKTQTRRKGEKKKNVSLPSFLWDWLIGRSPVFFDVEEAEEAEGRRRKWNGISTGIYRNGYQGFSLLYFVYGWMADH
jgi:hypothetical protein